MSKIFDRFTGRPATVQDLARIRRRAAEIFQNPYASPEQLEWAVNVYPEGIARSAPLEPTIYTKP